MQATPSGNFTYTYDQLGRLLTQTLPNLGSNTYDYVTAANGRQQVSKITGPAEISEYTYDNLGRLTENKETLQQSPNSVFKTNFTYDKYGRMSSYTYPNGFVTTSEYDVSGMLRKIKNGNTVLWELKDMLAPGLVSEFDYAGNFANVLSYDTKFHVKSIASGTMALQTYTTHHGSGDITSRAYFGYASVGVSTNNNESFVYDEFDRLKTVTYWDGSNTWTRNSCSYQDNGNLQNKSDCGDYVYGTTGSPYKLTQVNNAVSGGLSIDELDVVYNSLKKVAQITDADAGKTFNFTYGVNAERLKMDYLVNNSPVYTRFYQPNYDRQENTNGTYKEWCYVYAPTGLCAVNYNNNGVKQTLQVVPDHLGSPVLVTNNNSGSATLVEESSFDAWGRRRDPGNWNTTLSSSSSVLIRGFEMHEMLDEVGIINMNGRVYDPVLGRFLQPDPYIGDPDNVQNYNRYAYCLNNPLKYTDPSGNLAQYTPPATTILKHPGFLDGSLPTNVPEVYVDGEPVGGAGTFWLGGGGGEGVTSTYNIGFTGTLLSHLSFINGPLLNMQMHTGNENIAFNNNYSTNTIKNTSIGSTTPPPGWGVGAIVLPESTINPEADLNQGSNSRFWNGFLDSQAKSNFGATSTFMGEAALAEAGTESLLRVTLKGASTWGDKAHVLRSIKGAARTGVVIGIAGLAATVLEDAQRPQGTTWGTGVKSAILGAGVAFPVFGLIYGVVDLGTGVITGKTITDRIGDGVDSAIGN